MSKVKESGVEWIGVIPNHWKTLPFKRLVRKHYGGCWGEEAKGDPQDILCIRIADFNFGNQSIKETASTMRNYSLAQIEKGLLQDKDLIVEKSGGGEKTPVGRVVVFDEQQFPNNAMFANFSECIRLKEGENPRFVAYHLKALYYAFDMRYYFHQTTGIQNLDMPAYLATKLCSPSLSEQQMIVEYLDKKCGQVDELIKTVQSQIEKLKAYRISLITEAVTLGLNPNAETKESGVEWFDRINSSYNMQSIRSLFRIRKEIIGHEPETVLSITQKGLRVKDINENSGQMANSYATYQIVHAGDFAMNHMDLLTGGIGISECEGVTSPDYRVFVKKNSEMCSKYFLYVFETYYRNKIFYAFGQGAANLGRWRLPAQNFNSLLIPVPKTSEQFEIAAYLDKKCKQIEQLIEIKLKKIENLEQYKKSLIYEYVTGKKEVS